jgi:hypothetical protein
MSKVNQNMFGENGSVRPLVIVFLIFSFVISPSIQLSFADPNDVKHIVIHTGDTPSAVSPEQQETVGELFTDVELYRPEMFAERIEDEADSAILRSRYVHVNYDYLKESESIIVNLFEDVSAIAVRNRIEERSESQYTWFGQVPDRGLTSVILTVEDGDMAGFISFDGKVYQVNPLGNEIHTVRELCPCDFPPDGPDDVLVPPAFYSDPNTLSEVHYNAAPALWYDDGSTIDVMVVYTDDVDNASGNIAVEIQLAIDQANQTYEDSGIYQRLRLVHMAKVNYEETSDANADLNWIRNNDEIRNLRGEYRADVVSFLVLHMADWCGMAWGPWDLSGHPVNSEWAYSVVKRDCSTSNYTFTHELGHNMGAGHDLHAVANGQPSHSGAFPYSHGYTWDAWLGIDHFAYRSIMAYANWCNDHWEIYSCPKVGYWSSPNIYLRVCAWPFDWPCTDYYPFGYEDTVDNHRTLNETAYEVANFRQSNLPPICDAGGPYVAECNGSTTAVILDGTGSSDPDDDLLTYAWSSDCPDAFFDDSTSPMPTLMVNTSNGCSLICNVILTVTDEVGLSDTCETTFTVQDTIPPDFELSVDPVALWPPNNKMVKITPTWTESDICDPEPEVSLVQITMNESGNGNQDMQVTEDGSIYLRASRSGKSKPEGRIYTITFQACDCSGNCTIQSATVTVPHDRRRK